jgi:hypothetical protein
VATRTAQPGGWTEIDPVTVDTRGNARVYVVVKISLFDEFLEREEKPKIVALLPRKIVLSQNRLMRP